MTFVMTDIDPLKRILEAVLLAAAQPLSLSQLSAVFEEQEAPSREDLSRALEQLSEDCEGRGVELVEVASGFRYQVRADVHSFVTRLWTERQTRYSRALLETLALIAYRQPVTRGEIEQVRGVGVSTSIIKTLEEREWVRVVGYRDVPGKPALLGTTRAFLDYFNLKSLDELPALSELRDLTDPDMQLSFSVDDDGDAPAITASITVDEGTDAEAPDMTDDSDTHNPTDNTHSESESKDDMAEKASTPSPETSA